MDVSPSPSGTAQKRYESLSTYREPFLKRARECSELTIPSLIPPDGHTGTSELYRPYQSVGSNGVNNLASKLLLSLFPPNSPFFQLKIDEFTLEKDFPSAQSAEGKAFITEVQEGLSKIEQSVMGDIEASADRVSMYESLRHLIVGGNVTQYSPDEGGLKVYHLDQYVCKRDTMGNLLELIVKESLDASQLTEEAASIISEEGEKKDDPEKPYDLYTHVKRKRKGKGWDVYQELCGKKVPGSEGTYGEDNFPWMVLRFTKIDGEDYGRGFVEEVQGDLYSLEGLAQSIVEGSAASAKLLFLVNPNGVTRKDRIAKARNGSIIEGNAADVSVLQAQKQADLTVASNTAKTIEDRLARRFLLNSSIQRNGERVTAEEIRYLAQELDTGLGGPYSNLSVHLQLPYAKRKMAVMQAQGRLPKLPKKVIKPTIVTGIEALGRGNDLNKLDELLKGAAEVLGPGVVQQFVIMTDYFARRATALGIDIKGLIKSQEDIAAEQQQAAQAQMMQGAMPNIVKAGGDIMKQSMANGQPAPQGA